MKTVTIYTVPGCASCEAIKRFLGARQVPYTEKGSVRLSFCDVDGGRVA